MLCLIILFPQRRSRCEPKIIFGFYQPVSSHPPPPKKNVPSKPIDVERAEQIFYLNYLREGMTVFDAGANIGELTLLFSRFTGTYGQVHSFEASNSVFTRLNSICKLAGKENIFLNHLALANKNDIVKLYVYDDDYSGWNTLAQRPLKEYGINVEPIGIEEVPATTVDSYCEKRDISKIDLLKIDVEGAEYQVLLGAHRMLANKQIRCCVFEFGQTTFDMGNNPNEIEDYLKQLGYQICNVVKGNPVFPGRQSAKTACFSIHIATPKT